MGSSGRKWKGWTAFILLELDRGSTELNWVYGEVGGNSRTYLEQSELYITSSIAEM